jgi:hypothetical protein
MRGRVLAAVLAGALALGGAACSDDGDDEATTDDTEAAETTEAATDGADESEADGGGEDVSDTTEAETTTTVAELDNTVIQETVTADDPDAAALVDWTIFRWVLGSGYTATVPEGTSAEDSLAVCEAISAVLDAYDDVDPIAVVAGPDEAALAGRESPDTGCAAA